MISFGTKDYNVGTKVFFNPLEGLECFSHVTDIIQNIQEKNNMIATSKRMKWLFKNSIRDSPLEEH